jgi:DNA-binding beta-propeller fold protein YncE
VSSAGDWIGYAYVLNSIGGTVAVIGPDTYGFVTLIGTITVGNRPGSAAVTPDGLHVYSRRIADTVTRYITRSARTPDSRGANTWPTATRLRYL